MAATVSHLASTISCHAWNADRSMLALCPNSNEVWIFEKAAGGDWTKKWTLKEHEFLVTGIDWHPETNKIVTCGQDRNAFVWHFEPAKNEWKATVVLAGLDRAALCVKWAPNGKKFAIASSNKNVVQCWFDTAGNWYINSVLKKEKQKSTCKSSAVSLSWHPNGQILAVGSTDYRCRVLFAYLGPVDGVEAGGPGPDPSPFAAPGGAETGDVLADWEMTKAWVNDAQWSPSGSSLAFIGHDGLLHVTSFAATDDGIQISTVKTNSLPGMCLLWLSERSLVVGGHSCNPEVFASSGPKATDWKLVGQADVKDASSTTLRTASSFGAAHAMFAARVNKGESSSSSDGAAGAGAGSSSTGGGTASWTKHQGCITNIHVVARNGKGGGGGAGQVVSKFSTSGLDGKVIVWSVDELKHLNPATQLY